MEFKNQKSQRLGNEDLSRKGSIDEPIKELINLINAQTNYFTTSSCSGRIIVFESAATVDNHGAESQVSTQGKPGKKGCRWLHVSHSKVTATEIEESLKSIQENAVFKFEAMVMHIQCQSLEHAQQMHQAAVSAGFRNSGISIGSKGKLIVGVRSTHSLEAPLSKDGDVLVSTQYRQFLIECANEKMDENILRINRFHENLKLSFAKDQSLAKKEKVKSKKLSRKDVESHDRKRTNHQHSPHGQDKEPLHEDSGVKVDADDNDDDQVELDLTMFENM